MLCSINKTLLVFFACCALAGGVSEAATKYSFKPTLFLGSGTHDVSTNPAGVTVAAWGGGSDYMGEANYSIFVQRYNATGIPLGRLLHIDPTSSGPSTAIYDPAVGIDPQGRFVVAYSDDSEATIRVRMYDAVGKYLKQLSVGADGDGPPDVAMDVNGNFVVTWQKFDMFVNKRYVRARRFDAQGNPSTDVFDVSAVGEADSLPHIAMSNTGDFAIVFQRSRTADCVDSPYSKANQCDDVVVRRFDAQAVPQGNELVVSDGNKSLDQAPDIAMDDVGNFVVVWQRFRDLCQGMLACDDIVARRYSSAGNLVGQLDVVADNSNADAVPRVVMDGTGKFVASWWRKNPAPGRVLFQAYDAGGVKLTTNAVDITDGMDTRWGSSSQVMDISNKGVLNVILDVSLSDECPGGNPSPLVYRRLIPSNW